MIPVKTVPTSMASSGLSKDFNISTTAGTSLKPLIAELILLRPVNNMPNPRITSAILEDKNIVLEKTLAAVNTHSVALMPLIKDVLFETNLTLNDIDLFACDKGPRFFYWN